MARSWETSGGGIRGAAGTQQAVPSMETREGLRKEALWRGKSTGHPVSPGGTQTGLLCSSVSSRSEIRITRQAPPAHDHTWEPASCLQEGWPSSDAIARSERTLITDAPEGVVTQRPLVRGTGTTRTQCPDPHLLHRRSHSRREGPLLHLPWPQKVEKGRGRAPNERGMETRCLFRAGRLSRVSWRHRCLSGSSPHLPVAHPPAGPLPSLPGHEGGEEAGQLEGASQSLWRHQHAQVLSAGAGLHPFPGSGHHGEQALLRDGFPSPLETSGKRQLFPL